MNAEQQPATNDELIHRMTQIVLENLTNEQFGVSELAERVGMNRSHLYRKVLVLTKKSLSQFIREIRLSEALKILKEEEVTVSEAAYRVGFSNPSYFHSCFRNRYGFPPGEAKDMNLESASGNKSRVTGPSKLQAGFTRKYALLVILILLVIISVSAMHYLLNNRDSIEDKSIAVLPFINDSHNDSTTNLINGIMDEIMINLQTIKDLRVPGRTSIEKYRNTAKTVPEIAEELGVSFILEGSGQIFGNTLDLRVQLLEGATGIHIWGVSIEKEIESVESIIDIQSEIAESIARELEAAITPEEKRLIEKIPTTSLTAYDLYQAGREEYFKYLSGKENIIQSAINDRETILRAEKLFYDALDYDPSFALAYTGLADVYRHKHYGEEFYTPYFLDSMLILADKALSFDRKSAQAYVSRGHYYRENLKKEQAVYEYDMALKFNPNCWEAYWFKGELYMPDDYLKAIDNYLKAAQLHRGSYLPQIYRRIARICAHADLHQKAIFYLNEALKLDDDSSVYYTRLAFIEDGRFDFEKAIEFYRKSYTVDSALIGNVRVIGQNYLYLDQYKESLANFVEYEKEVERVGKNVTAWAIPKMGYAYSVNGFKEKAELYFNRVLEMSEKLNELERIHRRWNYYNPASLFAFKGDREKAYEYLELDNTRNKKDAVTVKDLKFSPLFDNIRNEPEFQEILMAVEANYKAEAERIRQWLEENDML